MGDHAGSRRPVLTDLRPALLARVPALLGEVADELAQVSPEYAAVLTDRSAEVLQAAEIAMDRLIAQAGPDADGAPDDAELPVRSMFEELGRQQRRAGYPFPALLAAFRTGARVAWRHVSSAAVAADVDTAVLADLGAAVFQLVDQLSSAAAAGYVAEQEESGRAQQALRDELAQLLLSDRSDTTAVRFAARRAGWPLPQTATVVLAALEDEQSRAALARLEPGCLGFRSGTVQGVVVPDPDAEGRRDRLAHVLAGCRAVVGITLPLDQLPSCARLTRTAADLHRAGVLRDNPTFVDDQLGTLLVHREPRLLQTLRERRLAPLRLASSGSRPALQDTLRSWLLHLGDNRAVAAELQVHPQTVRYRLARLRELYGADLDDPRVRSELVLVLAWN